MDIKIPFCKITLGEEEKKANNDVIDSGWVVMGDKTRELEEEFAKYVGSKYAVMTDSGTSALFLATKYTSVGNHFLVAVPSFTFTATAGVVVHAGGDPLFVDVEKETMCMDRSHDIFSIPVHLTGNKAQARGEVYDSAHRIIRGDVTGSSAFWCYSFYGTKNMNTASGGMIATNNKKACEWFKKARDHGMDAGTTERYRDGKPTYSIDFVGWRMKPTDIDAAVGLEQLKKLDEFNEKRAEIVKLYNELLGQQREGLHVYPILVVERPRFIDFMRSRGIQVSVHFRPLHKMPAYKQYSHGDLENTEYLGKHVVSLPIYPQMTKDEVTEVARAAKESGLLI